MYFLFCIGLFFFLGLILYQVVPKTMTWIGQAFENNSPSIQITSVTDEITKQKDPSFILKENYFDPTTIKSYYKEQKKFIFRPQTLEEYIGQENAKELVKLNIRKIKEVKPVHILISGHRGCGKTTLAHIIKNLLNARMIERIAGEIQNPDQIADLMNEINDSKEDLIILFLDEIHALKPNLCEVFYPIMEDFKIAGKLIKPFILIGATTEKNILMKKVAPMVDRFQVQIELEKYSKEDIITLLKQYKNQLYVDKIIPETHYIIISENARNTPRLAITLLEDSLIEKKIENVLKFHNIITNGLTKVDLKILKILYENKRAIGGTALAQMVGITSSDYQEVYEPFLCEEGFIIRTARGRTLSTKGEKYLQEINNDIQK